jgi:hypothetical protein
MPKKRLIVLVALAFVIAVLASWRTCVLRQSMSAGQLYWSSNQALLFISESSEGADMSYARYELEPIFVSLHRVRPPSNRRCSATPVVWVSDHEIRRYDTDLYRNATASDCGFHFDLFQGRIYAVAWPKLWRWTGAGFETATAEETRAFGSSDAARLSWQTSPAFDNIDGWSMRKLGQTPPRQQIVLNGQPLKIVFHGEAWPSTPLSVQVIRNRDGAKTVWRLDEAPHRVSKSEFERLFGRPNDVNFVPR